MTRALASLSAPAAPRASRPAPIPQGSDIALPTAFLAFYALQQPTYRAYAAAHTTPAEAEAVIRDAFGTLAAHWSDILMRPDPIAYTWDLFTSIMRRSTHRLRLPADCPLQYEIVVLHYLAGCTPEHISDTTGRHLGKVRYLLSTWAPSKISST
ncbi:hypothetical protein ACFC0C_28380 [Streptomyces sp. NPDC056178]|uniref:hypothetical protein n=1 Tax=unclassified Streptomyces TaxID=2593676 RepID=UPI0035DD6D88